jgi:hypothetical protein
MDIKNRTNYPPVNVRDGGGNVVSWMINNGEYDVYTATQDKYYDIEKQPYGFFIIPITTGTITVQLFNQADDERYEFSAVEVSNNQGKILPARVKAVFVTGTTVNQMKIVW